LTGQQPSRTPAGASEATRLAFEQYRQELHRFLVRRLRDPTDAQDVGQDVYLRFLQVSQRETVREPQAFLYRLASNLVYELRVRRRGPVTFDSQIADIMQEQRDERESEDALTGLSTAQQIDRALLQLPKSYQTVLLLRKRDGLTPDEIAERVGLSKATVYTYLIRAIALFKARFNATTKDM
jgi:RNA polymerase sigma factor (sigma-70 family)